MSETIFALATAHGKAGVAILRVSGPAAFDACAALCGDVPERRRASLRELRHGAEILDEALVLTFGRDGSFTGEDVVEYQVHGSRAVIAAVLRALSAQPGLRLAEPGEFTRRALENGRLDLTQVEGLADLIDAETEMQRRQAMRMLEGRLGRLVDGWRAGLIRAAALVEATIDFADEDVPVDVTPEVSSILTGLIAAFRAEAVASGATDRVRDGFEVAILGAPNAGKSTLLNALAGREAALTSEIAGTTRDVIEVRMDLAGLPVTLLDTAGLRQTDDRLEGLGIERAIQRARGADLRVYVLGGEIDARAWLPPADDDIVVHGKSDTGLADGLHPGVSGLTGAGLDALLSDIASRLAGRVSGEGLMTRARHRDALGRAIGGLESTLRELELGRAEIAAFGMREVLRDLDGLVGRIDVEMLLGEIFASFCIGK